jgi:hypothetical protein
MYFNGAIAELSKTDIAQNINLYVVIPSVNDQFPYFEQVLSHHIENPHITSITLFKNCKEDEADFIHDKIKIIESSNVYGLKYDDIFQHFEESAINIFVQDIVAFDTSLTYIHALTKKQIGLISSRTFDKFHDIPNEVDQLKNFSTESPSLNFKFNGIIVRGKPNILCDFILDIYGSLNLLILSMCEKYEVVNVSKIVLSYLLAENPDITENETYMADEFPVIHSSPQLYYFEDLNVTIPDTKDFLQYNTQPADLVTLDPVKESLEVLPLSDQLHITEVKNKILSTFFIEYREEHNTKMKKLEQAYESDYVGREVKLNARFEEQRVKLAEELKRREQEEKNRQDEQLRLYSHEKRLQIESQIKQKLESDLATLTSRRVAENEKLDNEIASKLESELKRVKKITDDTESSAYLAFKHEIEAFSKKAYSDIAIEVASIRQRKMNDVYTECSTLRDEEIEKVNEEHIKEKERLDVLLAEYELFKKQETETKFSREYFEQYSKAIAELHTEMEVLKVQKMTDMHNQLSVHKEQMFLDFAAIKKIMKHQTELKLNKYELDSMKKIDAHVETIIAERKTTEEIKLANTINELKKIRTREIEEKIMEDVTQEVSTIRETMLKNMSIELEALKKAEMEKTKLNQENQLQLVYHEKVKEQTDLLAVRWEKLVVNQDEEIKVKFSEQLVEVDNTLRTKKHAIELELQDYKTQQMLELKTFIQESKENEDIKLDLVKKFQEETIKDEYNNQKKKIDDECQEIKRTRIEQIEKELIEEKEKINAKLVEEFKNKLEEKHKIVEEDLKSSLAKNLTGIEKENESLTNKILKKLKATHQVTVDSFKEETVELQKELIKAHNAQVKKLEQEYVAKTDMHKILLKATLCEERESLLGQLKIEFNEELKASREAELAKQLNEIEKEIGFVKSLKLEQIDAQISAIKSEKMKAIDGDMERYRRDSEKAIREQYKKLYESLK